MGRSKISINLSIAFLAFSAAASVPAADLNGGETQSGGLTVPIVTSDAGRGDKLERPARPDKAAVPEDVKSRLDQFKLVRETFLTNQKDLTRKLKDATQEERDKIREQIQLQKQQFKAQAKELAQQVKESARDLDSTLGHKAGQEGGTVGHGGRPDR